MGKPLLEIDRVTKKFGDYTAVTQTSFNIERVNSSPSWDRVAAARPRCSGCWPDWKNLPAARSVSMACPQSGLPPWERDLPLVWQSLALFPLLSVLTTWPSASRCGVPKKIRHEKARELDQQAGTG